MFWHCYLSFILVSQLWPGLRRRFYTVETWSSCLRWCWPSETSWTRVRGGTLTASRCLRSTRSLIPNPVSTSKNVFFSTVTSKLACSDKKSDVKPINWYRECDVDEIKSNTFHIWLVHSVCLCVCRNITLLHYLITILEKKYPKVLMFQEDLQSIAEAAKVK